ncbi:MAG: protein kinase domain-containing protein, partial [Terriglobales bacterium]
MPLTPGTSLGPYEILAPLGAGGMGEVYRARDTRLKREVAIKVLPAAAAHDARALQRMEQEARAVAALNHPNLLSIYDIGQTSSGEPYLVTELLEGESLRQRLQAGAIGQQKAVDYAAQIARGLAAAHEKGIVHRDLKPENVYLTRDGRVKILDFGLAKLNLTAGSEDVTVLDPAVPATAPGAVLGTVGYMAPEQVRGKPADARSDIFSLGAVMYEMLTGRRAFRGDSAVDVMSAILREDPEPLAAATESSARSAPAPALDPIVRHCLEKDPRQRFQSADDIAFQLGQLTQTQSSSAALPALRARRRSVALPLVVAALVVAVGVILWLALRGSAAPGVPTLQRITYQQGMISGAAFLPGDQSVVMSASWGGSPYALYTAQSSAAGTAPTLERLSSAGDTVVATSSQGAIALLGLSGKEVGVSTLLSIIPPGGSAPRPVAQNALGATFASDGTLAIVRENPSTHAVTLEHPMGHVLYRCPSFCSAPRFSPDGKSIAFLDHPQLGDTRGALAIVNVSGPVQVRRLSPEFNNIEDVRWAPSGREIWFSASNAINLFVYKTDLHGHLHLVWQSPSDVRIDGVAPDGRVLVTSFLIRGVARVGTVANPVGTDESIRSFASNLFLTADGKQAVEGEEAGVNTSTYSAYLRQLDSDAPPVRLGDGRPLALSPDGQWALSQLPDPALSLELLPVGPGEPRRLTPARLQFYPWGASFLP